MEALVIATKTEVHEILNPIISNIGEALGKSVSL